MLAADKLQLQSQLKQQATALKEKEFQLHHSNLMTVGTQAAVLAGLDITMFIEFNPAPESNWAAESRKVGMILHTIYYAIIVAAFCANMIVVSHTTALAVYGAGLALRGPDGSMMTATDGLYEERAAVFWTFGWGLFLTVGSVLVGVWLMLPAQAALACWLVALVTLRTIFVNYRRVTQRFGFDESETVDFRDIMEGPAVKGLGKSLRSLQRSLSSSPADGQRYGRRGGRRGKRYDEDRDLEDESSSNDVEMQKPLTTSSRHRTASREDLRRRRDMTPDSASKKIVMT